jgi:hypothetical protein
VGGNSLLWAEAPDEDGDAAAEDNVEADVDDSFAARRLRRWIRGMFGGPPAAEPEEPGRETTDQ